MTKAVNPKFDIGDKVRVVNYGHRILSYNNKEKSWSVLDIQEDVVGNEGVIDKVSLTQGTPAYAILGISNKYAWYDENQLEMANKNTNI